MRSFWSALEPWHQGVYVNFLMDEGEERVRQAYGAGEVRPAEGAEAAVRPGQLLPAQPEHPAELGIGPNSASRRWGRGAREAWRGPVFGMSPERTLEEAPPNECGGDAHTVQDFFAGSSRI